MSTAAPPHAPPAPASLRRTTRLSDPERGAPALVLLEEAIHLLRFAPARVRTFYLTGTVPFLLGFLYFWADMTRNVNAEQHLVAAALVLTLLFFWMKCWQCAATSELHLHCAGATLPPWTRTRLRRLIYIQGLIQPLKLVVLPLAAILTLPFAAACAYFHTVAIYGDGTLPLEEVRKRARAVATPWTTQNFMALMWICLGGLFVFVNIYILGILLPQLLSIFTGVETGASQSMQAYVYNSTFFAAALAAAHLFLYALTTAFYVVRCFRAQSRHDGRDLLRALELSRAARGLTQKAVALLLCAAFLLPAPGLLAAVAPAPAGQAPPALPRGRDAQLDRKLSEVFERREFAWRLPRAGREVVANREEGPLDKFFNQIARWIRGFVQTLNDWWNAFRDWMRRMMPERIPGESATGGFFSGALAAQPLLYVLIVLVVLLAAWVGWRQWRQRSKRTVVRAAVAAPVAAPVADVADESVLASQLPEDDWLRLAGELEAQGEYRLALRALFLSGLAGLAARGAVLIARHKSNRDYQREIERRGRNRSEWSPAFAEGVRLLERSWYGEHPATPETLDSFRGLLTTLRREPAGPPPMAPALPALPATA